MISSKRLNVVISSNIIIFSETVDLDQNSLKRSTYLNNMELSLPKNVEIIGGGCDGEPDKKEERMLTSNQVNHLDVDAEIGTGRSNIIIFSETVDIDQNSLKRSTDLNNMELSLPKNVGIIGGGCDGKPDKKEERMLTSNQVNHLDVDAGIGTGRSDWRESNGRDMDPISNFNTGDDSTLSDCVENEFRYSGNRAGKTEQKLESEAQLRNQSNLRATDLVKTKLLKPKTKQLTLNTKKSEYRQSPRYEVYKRLCRISRAKNKEIALLEIKRERVKKELLHLQDCYSNCLSSSYPNDESNSKVDLTEAEKSSANQMCFAGEKSQDKESDDMTSPSARPANSDVDTVNFT